MKGLHKSLPFPWQKQALYCWPACLHVMLFTKMISAIPFRCSLALFDSLIKEGTEPSCNSYLSILHFHVSVKPRVIFWSPKLPFSVSTAHKNITWFRADAAGMFPSSTCPSPAAGCADSSKLRGTSAGHCSLSPSSSCLETGDECLP